MRGLSKKISKSKTLKNAKKLLDFTGISSCSHCSSLLREIECHAKLGHPATSGVNEILDGELQ